MMKKTKRSFNSLFEIPFCFPAFWALIPGFYSRGFGRSPIPGFAYKHSTVTNKPIPPQSSLFSPLLEPFVLSVPNFCTRKLRVLSDFLLCHGSWWITCCYMPWYIVCGWFGCFIEDGLWMGLLPPLVLAGLVSPSTTEALWDAVKISMDRVMRLLDMYPSSRIWGGPYVGGVNDD